jgi:hypothetical protein
LLNKQKNHVKIIISNFPIYLFRFHIIASNSNLQNRSNTHQQDDAPAFKRFLFRHIEQALTDGWSNDGISGGSRSESSLFELSTYPIWTCLFKTIRELFESPPATNKIMRQASAMVRAHIDPDGKLSETRCKKCLPMAIKYYEDGLPSRYTRHFHEQRVRIRLKKEKEIRIILF